MDESLKKYLGTQKSAALEKYLDALTSKPEAKSLFVGFGVWLCDSNYQLAELDATGSDHVLWAHVVLAVKGVVDRRTAEDVLSKVDKEIDETLLLEQKPPRISYTLDDDSNTQYRAKSHRVRGTLPVAGDVGPYSQTFEHGEGVDDPTPPASPRDGYIVHTEFVEVELGSE
ncbi:hypothetical protein F4825DRAFT_244302 [Nemania diffusa]|nr:hypothetical protein F4825DRAFT_244302 [Nemania diffusa]